MTNKGVLEKIDINVRDPEKSPARKRSRLDPTIVDQIGASEDWKVQKKWSFCSGDIMLDNLADIGVGHLDTDSDEAVEDDNYPDFLDLSASSTNKARAERDKKIAAMLHSTISKETLQKLSNGQWDEYLLRKPKRELIFKINHFEHLSDEVILQIFHWLPKRSLANAALVCRRWHQLAQDESLWTRMDVSNRCLEPGAIGHILSRQSIILRLAHSEIAHPPILPGVKASLPDFKARLLYLDLSMVHISISSLISLFSKCQRLKKLSLEHVRVDENVLLALSRNRDLEILNLAMAEGITTDGMSYLLTNCCKLKELNLAWTYLSESCIKHMCSHLPSSLDRLNLSGCRKLLDDQNVADLVSNCPNLRELDLSDCTGLSGYVINHIVQLEELNFLALSRCYFIPYRSLQRLKVMNSLRYLDIHGGYIEAAELELVQNALGERVDINKFKFSSIARPTVGQRRTSIWGLRVRD
ncbi:hypothetical protein ILUMI_05743 [Ignelater luminosus]|uniref:F-box domain-containing protein n=1 Tax=Ignelater luminosus TaxID=2038154 RepID=A0A8K0GJU0_IGNLU|nr:hypothetical protein ILUMI_05743 [Ignelater luminosus]